MVKKAELHVHLEGTATPALVKKLAAGNGANLDPSTFKSDGEFAWTDFWDFLSCYDKAAAAIRSKDDYRAVTYDYLRRCALEDVLYVETFSSPDHAAEAGISYTDHLDGIAAGIDDARRDFQIEGRVIVTCVRHLGPGRAMNIARAFTENPHPYVVGFGMGGDEAQYQPTDFKPAFDLVHAAGYQTTNHAGEFGGPESIRATLDALPVSRIGHGVRAGEDPLLVEELADRKIPLELCPGSNIATGLFQDYQTHPFRDFMEAGCIVTLNSDDPPFFATSIGKEYDRVAKAANLDLKDLQTITRNALDAAFCDEELKEKLKARI
ncbi:adenosine deaminase [Sneathiella chinensis]|uniref:Adenosine deaminase n=1 Tax=Sneathiella chinensis TaxID=349750 RepID=A0ABQ5U211_9PROT|nr:adenosine deaminase [Sneathiella chinensis]GLQ06199.1 adenosine deaminase [Sneathiella chinensis]